MTDTTARTVVLTGATSGIGEAAAHRFAASAGRLLIHGPEPETAVRPLLDRLRAAGRADIAYARADFDHLDNVVALAGHIAEFTDRVDVLVNNAGRPGAQERRLSANGYEATLQTNYLAAALLTERLLPLLPASGRVVHVASATHLSAKLPLDDPHLEHDYDPVSAYARSKLAMVAHAVRQAAHYRPLIVSISPGIISTRLLHAMFAIRGSSPRHGAGNVVEAATRASVPTGAYIDDGRLTEPGHQVRDPAFREGLHRLTVTLLEPWLPGTR